MLDYEWILLDFGRIKCLRRAAPLGDAKGHRDSTGLEKVLRRVVRADLGTAWRRASERFANCRKFPWETACTSPESVVTCLRVTSNEYRVHTAAARILLHGPALTIAKYSAVDFWYIHRSHVSSGTTANADDGAHVSSFHTSECRISNVHGGIF